MSRVMPVSAVIIGAAAASLLTSVATVTLRQYRHRRHVHRELMNLIAQDQYEYIVLDLRNPEEYRKARIPGSMNLPFPQAKGQLPTENMFERIIVVGPNFRKARLIARDLDRNGYFNATHFGGFGAWKGPTDNPDTASEE